MDDKIMCPHCHEGELCWDSDADAEECGYTIDGTVSFYHCLKCGCMVEITVPYEAEV